MCHSANPQTVECGAAVSTRKVSVRGGTERDVNEDAWSCPGSPDGVVWRLRSCRRAGSSAPRIFRRGVTVASSLLTEAPSDCSEPWRPVRPRQRHRDRWCRVPAQHRLRDDTRNDLPGAAGKRRRGHANALGQVDAVNGKLDQAALSGLHPRSKKRVERACRPCLERDDVMAGRSGRRLRA
jgi:hypothetical protein